MSNVESLASYRKCCQSLSDNWPTFLAKREERLAQQRRYGAAPEKVAENILEDLFTVVLDWSLADFNNQVDYADLVLTRLGIKHLIVEVKRPGSLTWNQRSIDIALIQAHRYADEQKVKTIAVSDGVILYARDLTPGGHRDRALARLDQSEPPIDLWWLSLDGIYRSRFDELTPPSLLPRDQDRGVPSTDRPSRELLNPKYKLPASCFAYVQNASNPGSWHLPYRLLSGAVDVSRLPKAIQAILSNYRGAHVTSIPEDAVPAVLVTLGRAAREAGKIPATDKGSARSYLQLQEVLTQLGALDAVLNS